MHLNLLQTSLKRTHFLAQKNTLFEADDIFFHGYQSFYKDSTDWSHWLVISRFSPELKRVSSRNLYRTKVGLRENSPSLPQQRGQALPVLTHLRNGRRNCWIRFVYFTYFRCSTGNKPSAYLWVDSFRNYSVCLMAFTGLFNSIGESFPIKWLQCVPKVWDRL